MPLFQALGEGGGANNDLLQRRLRRRKRMKFRRSDEDGSVLSLRRLCLLNIAANIKDIWAKDYADNYLDQYTFRHIMGPFNSLSCELVEELTCLLCDRKQLSRAVLHLLLVPQLKALSLEKCPGLVTSALCVHISASCQGLWSLNLSGAQQLPSKVLCKTIGCLPALRSLSLAGTPCDKFVIREITQNCHCLRHLDVSRCHFLSPGALLCLGVGTSISCSGSTPTSKSSVSPPSCPVPLSPLPLRSLLALDIGFGEEEKDSAAAAAFILLSLPCLERVALEGVSQACRLIELREFDQANRLTDREGVPRLCEVWRQRQNMDRWSKKQEDEDGKEEESGSESEEYSERNDGPCCSHSLSENENRNFSQSGVDCVIQCLKDVRSVSCDSLDSLSRLCPNIHSIFISTDDDYDDGARGRNRGSLLASGLQLWSDQLKSLSLHHPGPLLDLLPALQVSGSSLLSLSLEGVKSCHENLLLDIIRACPRLRELVMLAETNNMPQVQVEEDEDQQDDQGLPRLPYLCSLTLRFLDEHNKMMPNMSWMQLMPHCMSYKRVLRCLLLGSPLLEKLSLVSLPCPLNSVLQKILRQREFDLLTAADSEDLPFERLRYVNLQQTDVMMSTVKHLMKWSKRLECIDLSHCRHISHLECLSSASGSNVQIIWS